MRINKKIIWVIIFGFISSFFFSFTSYAIDNSFEQDNDIQFYSEYSTTKGCSRILLPTINDKDSLIKVIDNYIKEKFPSSPFNGLGESFVNGAVATGISPFVAIAHLRKESGLGTSEINNWFNYVFSTEQAAINEDQSKKTNSYNGFGRKASDNQPTVWYPSSSGPVPVYKWSSWRASIDSTTEDTFFQYYKRKWVDEEQATTFEDIIPKYSGSSRPERYISQMNDWVDELITKAGSTISCINKTGLTLEQAKNFMETYKNNRSDSLRYIGGAMSADCKYHDKLANCVAFSTYFINKYTSLEGFKSQSGDGWEVVGNIKLRNKTVVVDNKPEVFSVFSISNQILSPDGHTGIVLAVDEEGGEIIIGEAACSQPLSWVQARVKKINIYSSSGYTYAHILDKVDIEKVRSDAGVR